MKKKSVKLAKTIVLKKEAITTLDSKVQAQVAGGATGRTCSVAACYTLIRCIAE